MFKSTVRVLPVLLSLLGSAACSHDEKPAEHAPPVVSGPAHELSSAVGDLSDARCDLEERCEHVGAGQTYENREACETKLRGSISDDLNTQDCPRGIADAHLTKCLDEIKAEKCGDPIDTLSRWNSCRKGEICAD